MAEKIDCRYYQIRKIEDESSYGTIATPADIIPTSNCNHPLIGNQLGELPCEKCSYYEKKKINSK